VVERGAFARSIAELRQAGKALPMLLYHEPNQVVGLWSDLPEDDKGLNQHLPPAATVGGDDAAELRAKLPELEVALATAQEAAASALFGVQAPHAES
jgi:phage head maturation protease